MICTSRDLEESLEIAETLKVLNTMNLEPKAKIAANRGPNDEIYAATLRETKRRVKEALEVS